MLTAVGQRCRHRARVRPPSDRARPQGRRTDRLSPRAAIHRTCCAQSWKSAAATPIRSSATASRACCRPRSSWCTGRAARSACCRWDGSTIASHRRAPGGDLHHLRRRDARARLEEEPAAGQGRRRRCAHGLFADGCAGAGARQPRARGGVLRARLRDHDALDRADDPAGGSDGIRNFSVFCNHITIVPTIKAILDSPDLQLDGFLGPAMCRW
jgi:hypothetical protein